MKLKELNILKTKSNINYDYQTIKLTYSRINKGLLAIPKAFTEFLPTQNIKIKVYFGDSEKYKIKKFSSFYSSTNENRIGGLKEWYAKNNLKEGDEIVLQVLSRKDNVYRIISEKKFIEKANFIQKLFDITEDEEKAESNINQLSNWVRQEKQSIIQNEFLRLANKELITKRKLKKSSTIFVQETTPTNLRLILGNIYNGLCQVCFFSFLKKNNFPYFEIHHLNPALGHHPKNLVLVCANCHRQFEYAHVQTYFNDEGWLMKVNFNKAKYHLNQAITKLAKDEYIKTVYL